MPKRKSNAYEDTPTSTYKKRVGRNRDGVTVSKITAQEEATGPTITSSGQAIVLQGIERWRIADEAEKTNRSEGLYDLKFSTGDQWPADILSTRGLDQRPVLVVNRVNQFLRQVANEELESRPAAQVDPVGDGGDPVLAGVIQGMFRHIEYDSVLEQVVSRKFDAVLRKGWAWYRVLTEYEDDGSFDNQKIVVRDIPNDFTVYSDPTAVLPDRSDMNWLLIVEDIPNGEYKTLYGDPPSSGLSQMTSAGSNVADWANGRSTRIAEYYYFDEEKDTLVKLANGKGKWKSELNGTEALAVDENNRHVTRDGVRRQLKWCKFNCERILEGNDDLTGGRDIPCKWIPVIFMSGEELNIDGQRHLMGMVRYARDPQRMYNYWNSALTEAIALAPKSPWIIASGQIEGFEQYWTTSNTRNWPFLPYKHITSAGQSAAPPQRVSAQVDTGSISVALRQADQDLMATMGIFRAGLGDVGPEKSGRAILARQKESDTSNSNFGHNRNWSLLHCYRCILDMMPHIYNSERAVRIIRPNNDNEVVMINQFFVGPDKEEVMYDIADISGKYAVKLAIGAPATRRQQAVQTMSEIIKAQPELFTMIGDLWVDQMDADGNWKQQMVERLRKMLPPQLQDNNGPIPPQVQQMIQQIMQQNQLLTQALTEAQDKLESNEADLETKRYIAELQAKKDILVNSMKFDSVESMEGIRQEYSRILEQLKQLHEGRMQDKEIKHEDNMQTRELANKVQVAKMKPKPTTKPTTKSK